MKIEDIDTAVQLRDKLTSATKTLERIDETADYPDGQFLQFGVANTSSGLSLDRTDLLPETWEKLMELLREDFREQITQAENAIDAL